MSPVIIRCLFYLLIFGLLGNCSSIFAAGETSSFVFFHVLVLSAAAKSRFLFYCSLASHFCALSPPLINPRGLHFHPSLSARAQIRSLPGLTRPSFLSPRRTLTPMRTSCSRRPSSWPKRGSATQKRSTRPPTSSKTESKTLFAAWSSAKSCWTCLSPSTRM